jgi:hypothetical protein
MLSYVLLLESFLNEICHRSSAGHVHKLHELALQKKAGMDRDNVEKFGFALCVAERFQRWERFG